LGELIQDYTFYYPLFMAYVWIIGALYFFFRWEKPQGKPEDTPELPSYPLVSILIPCFNEALHIRDTINFLAELKYPNYEIVAINDGSSDETGAILDALLNENPKLRVIHLSANQGKAVALRSGSLVANGEFLVCVDADALLDPNAVHWIMKQFLFGPRVGAVTGNPRTRSRSTLLGKIQMGEFSAIVGLIKRAQRIYGRVFTVSGVVSAFRKTALHRVGYWGQNFLTEDVDISWRLQLEHWDIRYEPHALCWILMPETLPGLLKQRLRWAIGGNEVILINLPHLFRWKSRRMWLVFFEHFCSVLWCLTLFVMVVLWALGFFYPVPEKYLVVSIIPTWPGVVLGLTCLLQFTISLILDSRYEQGSWRYYFIMIWYPLAYWAINWITTLVALPRVLLRNPERRGRWHTVDRGITEAET